MPFTIIVITSPSSTDPRRTQHKGQPERQKRRKHSDSSPVPQPVFLELDQGGLKS